MKVIVLGGAGHIGSGAVRQLVKRAPNAEVVIADKNLDGAKDLAKELGGKTSAKSVDANNPKSLIEVMKGADVAVSTIGPFYVYGAKILRAAISAKTNFVDIDDDYDGTKDCLDLNEEARKAGITAIVGMGLTPGLTNIMAKYGAEKLDKVDEIHTAWAWTGIDPTIGPAIVAHYYHACTGKVPTYRDGKWVDIPSLSEPEIVDFPSPLGRIEVSNVGHPEPVTIPRYIKGVKVVTNKGAIWPEYPFRDMTKVFADMGWSGLKEITIKGVSMPVRDILVALTLAMGELAPPETVEALTKSALEKIGEEYLMGVGARSEVRGISKGKRTRFAYGTAWRSAIDSTAIPAAIGALMVARGAIKERGVFAPEGVVDSKAFLKEISKDIEIWETKEEIL